MTSTLAPRQAAPAARLMAILLAACCVALGITVSPLATGAAAAATCTAGSSLNCVRLTSPVTSRSVDLEGASSGNGTRIVTISQSGDRPTQRWRFNVNPADSTFTILNVGTGKCIDVGWRDDGLREWNCEGQSTQKFYLQPWEGMPGHWRIRHANTDKCMDLLNSSNYDDAWVGLYDCHNGWNQQWLFTGEQDAAAKTLAVDYASKKCQANTWSCYWTEESESAAAPLPSKCISSVWYNPYSSPFNYTYTLAKTKGWSTTLGTSVTAGFETGALSELVAKVKFELTVKYEMVWSGADVTTNSVVLPAQPSMYNWVALATSAKQVTGTFTFDAGGFPWTAESTITVPIKDSESDTTFYTPASSPNRPACG